MLVEKILVDVSRKNSSIDIDKKKILAYVIKNSNNQCQPKIKADVDQKYPWPMSVKKFINQCSLKKLWKIDQKNIPDQSRPKKYLRPKSAKKILGDIVRKIASADVG